MGCSFFGGCFACCGCFFGTAVGVLMSNGFLGDRYDILMKCIEQEGRFTAYELGVHPQIMKKLADSGYLRIVEKRCTYPARPYSYVVPEKVRQRYTGVH